MLMIVHENHLKTIVSTQLFSNYFNSTIIGSLKSCNFTIVIQCYDFDHTSSINF